MRYQDEGFSFANNSGPDSDLWPFADPQRLAQLVMAARAARQISEGATGVQGAAGPQSGARHQSSAGQPSAAPLAGPVLPPTTPFPPGGGAPGPQVSSSPADADPAKAAAIQKLREAQANPQALATPRRSADPFPKLETPSVEDIANGNYIKVGFRHLLRDDPSKVLFHTYALIPEMKDGKPTGKLISYGVLGNPGTRKNQQVREDDFDPNLKPKFTDPKNTDKNSRVTGFDRNSQVPGYGAKEVWIKVTPEQREALWEGMKYFAEKDEQGNYKHPCPVCGSRYGDWERNSNTLIYNMLFWNPAGPIPAPQPPSRWRTPGYLKNEPNEPWYQKSRVSN